MSPFLGDLQLKVVVFLVFPFKKGVSSKKDAPMCLSNFGPGLKAPLLDCDSGALFPCGVACAVSCCLLCKGLSVLTQLRSQKALCSRGCVWSILWYPMHPDSNFPLIHHVTSFVDDVESVGRCAMNTALLALLCSALLCLHI